MSRGVRVFRIPITVDIEVRTLRSDDAEGDRFAAHAYIDDFVMQLRGLGGGTVDPIRVRTVRRGLVEGGK